MADTSTMACGWIEVQGFLVGRRMAKWCAWWFRNQIRKKAWRGAGVLAGQ
jgi:hypothetical protein